MGCNYYAIPKATDELKKKIIEAVEADDFLLAAKLIPQSVHIGKSSIGWQFCFNHNDWQYFDKSEESLEAFLLGCEIYDEYDQRISNDEFWKMVENKRNFLESELDIISFGLCFSDSTQFS